MLNNAKIKINVRLVHTDRTGPICFILSDEEYHNSTTTIHNLKYYRNCCHLQCQQFNYQYYCHKYNTRTQNIRDGSSQNTTVLWACITLLFQPR